MQPVIEPTTGIVKLRRATEYLVFKQVSRWGTVYSAGDKVMLKDGNNTIRGTIDDVAFACPVSGRRGAVCNAGRGAVTDREKKRERGHIRSLTPSLL
jgi:hypothetical protein